MSAAYHRADVQTPKDGVKRCPQCWKFWAWPRAFIGLRGAPVLTCRRCTRAKSAYYKGWRAHGPKRRNSTLCLWCGKRRRRGALRGYCSRSCADEAAADER